MSQSKTALRRELTAARKALLADLRKTASRAAQARLAALAAFSAARTVALYAPLGAEVDTADLARLAAADGKRVVWPRIRTGERLLELAAAEPPELTRGAAGALEPPPSSPALSLDEVDLVVVPGVAFDEQGHRLGRGGGYYDATLAALPARTFRAGLAFELQLVPALPREPHDARLDAVVTENRVILT